ncbi:hypothetical protein Ancab_005960 [Ancistrocladus abbreviatus]
MFRNRIQNSLAIFSPSTCMTKLQSLSAAESSMEDGHKHRLPTLTPTKTTTASTTVANSHHHSNGSAEDSDSKAWNEFAKIFSEVQSVLDRNRVLIQQVNENHQSKIPDNLVKNVSLIQEINGNISKVVSLYSDLSTNFLSLFHQQQGINPKSDEGGEKGGTVED